MIRLRAADGLGMAAAPTFALMAVLAALSRGPSDPLCGPAGPLPFLAEMTSMYALMAVFHAGPWLKRIGRRRGSVMCPAASPGRCGRDRQEFAPPAVP